MLQTLVLVLVYAYAVLWGAVWLKMKFNKEI